MRYVFHHSTTEKINSRDVVSNFHKTLIDHPPLINNDPPRSRESRDSPPPLPGKCRVDIGKIYNNIVRPPAITDLIFVLRVAFVSSRVHSINRGGLSIIHDAVSSGLTFFFFCYSADNRKIVVVL